ncbi:MAG TPA: NAD(P)H-hydrate epimerase [Thermomicrobiaceae bacterium]|nr:NAD(P)H-hydrate epimerase [Thermomicrobiaceae bacterium]
MTELVSTTVSAAADDRGAPRVAAALVPTVTASQMAEVDRLAIGEFGVPLLAMMEQAGSHLAELSRLTLRGDLRGHSILIAVGPGSNGGGGLAAARHLVNRGANVRVILARPALRLSDAARHQLGTLLAMTVSCCVNGYDLPAAELTAALANADLVIDALLGYNVAGAPRGDVAALLDRVNTAGRPIVSLDLPSGLDPDTGEAPGIVINATATLTLALPKRGLLTTTGRSRAGRLYLADLGLPAALYARVGLAVGVPFATGRMVELAS